MDKYYLIIEDENFETGLAKFLSQNLDEKNEIIKKNDLNKFEKLEGFEIIICAIGSSIYDISKIKGFRKFCISPVMNRKKYFNITNIMLSDVLNIDEKVTILNGVENEFCDILDVVELTQNNLVDYLGLEDMGYKIDEYYNRMFIIEELKK